MTTDKTELLPCPFCGGADSMGVYPQKAPSKKTFFVWNCHECGLVTRGFKTEREAISYWNTRAPSTCLEDAMDCLRSISENYENVEVGHLDFRIKAKQFADAILAKYDGRK